MTIRAVIVGIEQYKIDDMKVPAPAANAVAVAKWALAIGVPPNDIYFFATALDEGVTTEIEKAGVEVRGTTLRDIDTVLREELPSAEDGSALLFYWSGHGMTDNKGQRLLFCSDYTQTLRDRVFNASLFFRKLRTDQYPGLRRMLALLDVCGTNSRLPVEPASYEIDQVFPRRHRIFFATPEGGFAIAATGQGAFTYCALKALDTFVGFPDLETFKTRLDAELNGSQLDRFLLSVGTEEDEYERFVGIARRSDDQIADGLIGLVVELGISRSTLERHFLATARAMKNDRLLLAQGIAGMIRELNGVGDRIPRATYAIVQFVLRLCGDPSAAKHKSALKDWLLLYATEAVIGDAQHELAVERSRKLLIFDVQADPNGELRNLQPFLRNLDLTEVQGRVFDPIPVRSWDDTGRAVLSVLEKLSAEQLANDLEVHFVLEPVAFDWPFHRLPGLKQGYQLGEEHAVILHHGPRVKPTPTAAKRAWVERFNAISKLSVSELCWTPCRPGQSLPRQPTLCLAATAIKPGPAGSPGKKVLNGLIQLGAPYLYWPHDDDEPDAEQPLTELVRGLATLAEMPQAISQKRIADAGVVQSGSLLWDQPTFQPFAKHSEKVDE